MSLQLQTSFFFFFNDTATTEIYTLSLHDALPISSASTTRPSRATAIPRTRRSAWARDSESVVAWLVIGPRDRKSTRLNSSHQIISYAVFSFKKKKNPPSTQKLSIHTNYTMSALCI